MIYHKLLLLPWISRKCIIKNNRALCHDIFFQHDDIIKWKYFRRYWPFVGGIHHSSVNSPHKGQWHCAFMLSLIWTKGWINNCDVGDLRCHHGHYDITVMKRLENTWTKIVSNSVVSIVPVDGMALNSVVPFAYLVESIFVCFYCLSS